MLLTSTGRGIVNRILTMTALAMVIQCRHPRRCVARVRPGSSPLLELVDVVGRRLRRAGDGQGREKPATWSRPSTSAVASDDTAIPAYRSRSKRNFKRISQSSSKPSWRNFPAIRIKTITNGFLLMRRSRLVSSRGRIDRGPDLHIFVSEVYPRSKALVPAWLGQRGWMEFPAHRVVAGEASIAHELVHVLFPNGNRMLAEGLAVYLQHKLFPKISGLPELRRPFGSPGRGLPAHELQRQSPSRAVGHGPGCLREDIHTRQAEPEDRTGRCHRSNAGKSRTRRLMR